MRRTTISLPDDLAVAVEREARRRRVSVSEIARRALAEHVGLADGQPRRLGFIGIARSGYHDTAERMEEILAREWADDIDRDR
jgi:metal-responsive CopG/Arc/MetJ family transcriptional regulator